MTIAQARALYAILVTECHALNSRDEMESFVRYMADGELGKEWRFQGSLGFGGKCRYDSNRVWPYVTCYPEDDTPERLACVEKANARIVELFA